MSFFGKNEINLLSSFTVEPTFPKNYFIFFEKRADFLGRFLRRHVTIEPTFEHFVLTLTLALSKDNSPLVLNVKSPLVRNLISFFR